MGESEITRLLGVDSTAGITHSHTHTHSTQGSILMKIKEGSLLNLVKTREGEGEGSIL